MISNKLRAGIESRHSTVEEKEHRKKRWKATNAH